MKLKSTKLKFLATLLFAAVLHAGSALAAERAVAESIARPALRAPEAQQRAAEEGLRQWIESYLASGAPIDENFVFQTRTPEDLQSLHIGRGFQIEAVDAAELASGRSVAHATHPTGEWRFLIMLNDKSVGLATVMKDDDAFQLVGVGAKSLAGDIAASLATRPGAEARFVRSYETTSDFLAFREPATAGSASRNLYLPLMSARMKGFGATPALLKYGAAEDTGQPLDESAITQDLRNAIARGKN